MKYLFLSLIIFTAGCNSDQTKSPIQAQAKQSTSLGATQANKQLNLTILLDLSDRIDPKKFPENPEHYARDSALINYFTDYFLQQLKAKGTYLSKGKMRVIFHPTPEDANINTEASKLNIDLSKMNSKDKKTIFDSLKNTVSKSIGYIYNTAITKAVWPGSDIWRFFKNDIRDIAIDTDSSYRNLLIIFTDGYIYHADSKIKEGNRYSYITPELFDTYKLRNDNQWVNKIDKLDFGLITKRTDLSNLEVLVLEITPTPKHKNDEDIIGKVLDKWFREMQVKRWKVFNSDLPQTTKQKLEPFLSNPD